MYHPNVISYNRERLEKALRLPLREYSETEVLDFAYRMRGIDWDGEVSPGEIVKGLPEDFQRYIVNETHMCKISFPYWLERYAKIADDKGRLVTIKPWPSQVKLLDLIAEEELKAFDYMMQAPEERELQAKIQAILLKSRQVGGTVISEALVHHMVVYFANTRAVIASDHPDNSLKLWQVLIRMYDNLPAWMRPSRDAKVKANNLHLDRLDSDIIVGAGNQKTTFGQGMTIDAAHITELSSWLASNADAIDADLKPAFASSRKHHSLMIFESTGEGGKGNYFCDQYIAARDGNSLMKALFVGWFMCPDKWSIPAEGVEISKETKKVAKMIKQDAGIICTKEQLAWYQITRADYAARDKIATFFQEYPSTAEESFQSGYKSVFSLEVRNSTRAGCAQVKGVFRWNSAGKGFTRVDLEEWERKISKEKAEGCLLVWERPRESFYYVVGVDVAYGADGGDSSSIEVVRVGNRWEEAEQVAEWKGRISPVELADVVWKVCYMYTDKAEGLPARLAIEVNPGSPGIVTQTELLRRNYPNFWVWLKPNKLGGGFTNVIGFHTTPATRPLLTDLGTDAIIREHLLINSPYLVDEMDSFILVLMGNGKRKMEHAFRSHDDRLIALFIAYHVATGSEQSVAAEMRIRAEEMRMIPSAEIVEFQTTGRSWDDNMRKWEAEMEGGVGNLDGGTGIWYTKREDY